MQAVLTDKQIQYLVTCPKRIIRRIPAVRYQNEGNQRRGELELEALESGLNKFSVFIRQNYQFIENFSIGLRYLTGDVDVGTVNLVRYNGPHGEANRQPDGHFAKPHIHRMTEAELSSGSAHPQEKDREITDLYSTFDEALPLFLEMIGVTNAKDYFPELLQGRLFNGHNQN